MGHVSQALLRLARISIVYGVNELWASLQGCTACCTTTMQRACKPAKATSAHSVSPHCTKEPKEGVPQAPLLYSCSPGQLPGAYFSACNLAKKSVFDLSFTLREPVATQRVRTVHNPAANGTPLAPLVRDGCCMRNIMVSTLWCQGAGKAESSYVRLPRKG